MNKITNNQALAALKQKKKVILCASNLNPKSQWGVALHLNSTSDFSESVSAEDIKKDWKQFITTFKHYNCTNKETGLSVSYYLT